MSNPNQKRAVNRLMFDLNELQSCPLANVAAIPLNDNMFEWHCNVIIHGQCFHIILTIPDTFPYRAPQAEIMPKTYLIAGESTKEEGKGVEFCFELFSNFSNYHNELDSAIGRGCSSAYTIQGILLNLINCLEDSPESNDLHTRNKNEAKKVECPACGHTNNNPYPAFMDPYKAGGETRHVKIEKHIKTEHSEPTRNAAQEMDIKHSGLIHIKKEEKSFSFVDYMSKQTIYLNSITTKDAVVGFGVFDVEDASGEKSLLIQEDLISAETYYGMVRCNGFAESSNRHKLIAFIPCLINSNNSQTIQQLFEDGVKELIKQKEKKGCFIELATVLLCELVSSSLRQCIQQHNVNGNLIQSLFMLHHLFLWLLKVNFCSREWAIFERDELKRFKEKTISAKKANHQPHTNNVFLLSCSTNNRLVSM